MSKLNKVLAMSLAALTLAGSSSQVFAAKSRRSSLSESKKSDSRKSEPRKSNSRKSEPRKSDSRKSDFKPEKRNSNSIDYTQYTETVKNWYGRLIKKVGEQGQFLNRARGSAPTCKEVEAARALISKRGKKPSGFLEASILMSYDKRRIDNDKEISAFLAEIRRIWENNPAEIAKKEIYDLISENYSCMQSCIYYGFLSNPLKEMLRDYLRLYDKEKRNSERKVIDYTNNLIDRARKEFPDKDISYAFPLLIDKLIKAKSVAPAEMKMYVDRMVNHKSDLSFLKEIKKYVDESEKVREGSKAGKPSHSSLRKSK